ncbi:MAG: BON domain-containing protein [Candidatus Manganitrophaceae bacterium]|nr:MAG: BON domain-containing protein [Candidatus Manganitrophaceae bacterium]
MILEQEALLTTEDREIGARVVKNLRSNAVLPSPPDLRIVVASGVVRLEGCVSFPAEKALIEEIVRFTPGVLAVENALRLLPCSSRRSES